MVELPSRRRRGPGGGVLPPASVDAEQSGARLEGNWREGRCKYVSVRAYVSALKGLEVMELEGLCSSSVYSGAEKGLADSAGAAKEPCERAQKCPGSCKGALRKSSKETCERAQKSPVSCKTAL